MEDLSGKRVKLSKFGLCHVILHFDSSLFFIKFEEGIHEELSLIRLKKLFLRQFVISSKCSKIGYTCAELYAQWQLTQTSLSQ